MLTTHRQRCLALHRARCSLMALVVVVLGAAPAVSGQEAGVPRVILIGIDGLGSENVWRDAYKGVPAPVIPHIDQLKDVGAYTLKARIDPLNFSGPNWAGMVTGSMSSEHGVDTNECTRGAALPTIYEVLRDAFQPDRSARQHRIAVVHEWASIACYYDPSAVDFRVNSGRVNTGDERETADWVIKLIGDESVMFTFVYFGALDSTGHQFGGNSIEYKEKIEAIDAEIGRILAAIADSPQADSTYVILTADHGHLPDGGGHSSADAPVPFIVSGPDVAAGELDSEVRNNQVAPLVAHVFGAAPSPVWSAKLAPFDSVVSRPSVVAIDVTGPGSRVVNVGNEFQFRASTSFSDGTSRNATVQAVWSSSDEAVFTVSAGGRGAAVGVGDADVCATALGVTGCLSLTVTENSPPARVSRALPEDVRVHRDIAYAAYGDRTLRLDLFEPGDRRGDLLPAVVVIRGGRWNTGDKEAFSPIAAALAQRGFVAVSIEYRAAGEARFPAAVHDTKAAVRWLRAKAESYGIDPRAVGAIGGDAGAHLALYLGVTAGQASLEGAGGYPTESSTVSAVVALATPADLTLLEPAPTAFLGSRLADDRGLWEHASPTTHVSEASPPVLLIHSEADLLVPVQQSLEVAGKYRANGASVDVVLLPDAPHGFWNYARWFDDTMNRAADFFRRHLRSAR